MNRSDHRRSTVGLDLGTSGVRAVVLDCHTGEIQSEATQPVGVRTGGDLVTADADEIVDAVLTVLARTPAELAADVAAIGFSVQGEAFVPLDRFGRAVDRVPLSMDKRGAGQVSRMADALGAERFQQLTGQPLNEMFPVFKIAAESDRWDAARYLGLGDHVLTQLGGGALTDWTQAARTGLFDVEARAWSQILAEPMGLACVTSRMARPVAAGTVAGTLSADIASLSGLSSSTRLVVGMHDQAAAFLGAGGVADHTAVMSLGTSECVTVGSGTRLRLEGTGVACYPALPGLWMTLAGTAAGGWGLTWLAELTGAATPQQQKALLDAPAAQPGEVLLLPYFTGSGTLDNDPVARGTITGLTLNTRADQLVRAFYESSGYEMAKVLGALSGQIGISAVHIAGAGSQNRRAVQIRADAIDLTLSPVHPQAAARGAAVLAGGALGESVPAPQLCGAAVVPNLDHRERHLHRRQAYRDLYDAIAGLRPESAPTTTEAPRGTIR